MIGVHRTFVSRARRYFQAHLRIWGRSMNLRCSEAKRDNDKAENQYVPGHTSNTSDSGSESFSVASFIDVKFPSENGALWIANAFGGHERAACP